MHMDGFIEALWLAPLSLPWTSRQQSTFASVGLPSSRLTVADMWTLPWAVFACFLTLVSHLTWYSTETPCPARQAQTWREERNEMKARRLDWGCIRQAKYLRRTRSFKRPPMSHRTWHVN